MKLIRYNKIDRYKRKAAAFLLVFILFSLPVFLFGQTPSDSCGTSIGQKLPVGCVCNPVDPWNFSSNVTSPTPPSCGGANTNYTDGWGWFQAVATSTTISYTSSKNAVLYIYGGSCGSLSLIGCSNSVNGNGTETVVASTVVGQNYFVRAVKIDPGNMTGSICVYSVILPANDEPCSATPLTVTGTCNYTTYTNQCATASAGIPAPLCANYLGGDLWFSVTVPQSGTITIGTNTGTISDGGMAIYNGACNALTLVSCDDNNSPNGLMPQITLSCLAPGTTLWIRFWNNENNNSNGTFQICAYESTPVACGTPQANDYPCNAIPLPIGVTLNGDNTCAGSCNEPATPSCWVLNGANDAINTVWYSIVCPSTGNIRVRTYLGTLTNTMIALYSGSCGALTQVAGASSCNDDAAPCTGALTPRHSAINVTGLDSGQTYFLAVDGYDARVGTFNVTATDGSAFAPIPQQDCVYRTQICARITTVGNPGFTGAGNVCDFSTPYSCFQGGGERNSVFYSFTTNAPGTLVFDITPNLSSTDYDFMLWNVTGISNPCDSISSRLLLPIRCNYSVTPGTTGLRTSAINPSEISNGPPFCSPVTITAAGQQFILMVNNFSSNNTGYTLDFQIGSPLSYSNVPDTLYWSGGVSTDWHNSLNWGGCAFPTCNTNVIIVEGPTNQPSITAPNASCKSITISPNTSLTINATNTLTICQDFTNNGTLNANIGSTILFNNANSVQNINGNLVGTSRFGNLTITKTGGSVQLNQSIDVGGNFTTTNSTSVFSTNGNYVKVGGNFNNENGNTTFSNIGSGTLEFFDSLLQSFNNKLATLTLNNVVMNKSGNKVNLSGTNSNLIIGPNGTLTLNNGIIVTGASNEVTVLDTIPSSVSVGAPVSYVDGFLRRSIGRSIGAYDFPVGDAIKGYQRATVDFITAPASSFNLLASFNQWTTVPFGPPSYECMAADYSIFKAFDQGFWTINASSPGIAALYNLSLYNLNYSNNLPGSQMWSVMKRSPSGTGLWALSGVCTISTPGAARRDSLSGFSDFATVQFNTPLPIRLLSFTADRKESSVRCEWITATEVNNDRFVIQRTRDLIKIDNLGVVKGAGNSTSTLSYSFEDHIPLPGLSYYRLAQVDFDGTSSSSNWVAVSFLEGENHFFLYPNPASTLLNCEIFSSVKKDILLVITDVYGKTMFSEMKKLATGQNHFSLNIEALSDGFYFINFSDETVCLTCFEHQSKFIKITR